MATLARNSSLAASVVEALDQVTKFFGDIARAGHAAARYQHLASMSDRQLAELGCTRENAARAAFEESFGKL